MKDSKGTILAPAIYDDIFEADYYYGISVIQKDSLFGYLQSNGKELVPPVYEEAFDVFDFESEPLGEIKIKGKTGILKVHSNTWILPPDYDSTEVITYGFLCVETGGKYGVSNFAEMIIPVESDNPYEYDYFPELFHQTKGTSKRRYYTKEGSYLGDFVEESIVKAGACFGLNQISLIKRQADR